MPIWCINILVIFIYYINHSKPATMEVFMTQELWVFKDTVILELDMKQTIHIHTFQKWVKWVSRTGTERMKQTNSIRSAAKYEMDNVTSRFKLNRSEYEWEYRCGCKWVHSSALCNFPNMLLLFLSSLSDYFAQHVGILCKIQIQIRIQIRVEIRMWIRA